MKWIVLAILVMAAPCLFAESLQVSGQVVSENRPVAGAEVALFPVLDPVAAARAALLEIKQSPAAHDVTDAAGNFHLEVLSAGGWKVRIEAHGLVPVETILPALVETTELEKAELVPDRNFRITVTGLERKPI